MQNSKKTTNGLVYRARTEVNDREWLNQQKTVWIFSTSRFFVPFSYNFKPNKCHWNGLGEPILAVNITNKTYFDSFEVVISMTHPTYDSNESKNFGVFISLYIYCKLSNTFRLPVVSTAKISAQGNSEKVVFLDTIKNGVRIHWRHTKESRSPYFI